MYKRKVDMASESRDLLIQALDDSKIELARLLSALGEKTIVRTVSKVSVVLFLNGYFFDRFSIPAYRMQCSLKGKPCLNEKY